MPWQHGSLAALCTQQGALGMKDQIGVADDAVAIEHVEGRVHEIAEDVAYLTTGIVNVVMCGLPGAGERRWLLVDTGLPGFARSIRRAVKQRFARGDDLGDMEPRPYAIIQTHGHFDHVGNLERFAERWNVPVFAHALERGYLDGTQSYPPPNPWAGGMMSLTSPLLPRGPVDVLDHLQTLPADGSIPGMPGWRWLHTPGHTPGHISLWRERDRLLIAGDAFITTRQESVYDALTKRTEIHGPPMYFTPDWTRARESVRMLANLEPELVITGHGKALQGPHMREALHELADYFDEIAVPTRGTELEHS